MKRTYMYQQIFHQCFSATCFFTNATSSLNFVNRLKTINHSILLKYQSITLISTFGILLAKNTHHIGKSNGQNVFSPEFKHLTQSIIIS